ncbi:MAG: septal ring lytic transglycosylase RlpA family protein [Ramlibacter sp.]
MNVQHRAAWLAAALLVSGARAAAAGDPAGKPQNSAAPAAAAPAKTSHGAVPPRQVGKASFYARRFAGRKMANGRPMDPNDDNAASKTLPLGTKARVTNLDTGRSALVTIEDRGPYVPGRIVDLSPATARKIGLEEQQGLAPVEVVPLQVPSSRAVEVGDASR